MTGVSKNRRRYLKGAGAAVSGGLVALAGCAGGDGSDGGSDGSDGSGDGGTTTGSPDTTESVPTLTVSPAKGTAGTIFHTIKERGLDTKHGVDLEIEWRAPPAAAKALKNRQVDTSFISVLATSRLNAQGQKMRQLWPMFTNNENCIVREDADVSTESVKATLTDLQDLTIGMLSKSSTMYSIFQLLLAEYGLSIDSYDIRTGPPPVLTGLTQKGDLDGMINIEPHPSKLVATGGFKRVLVYDDAWREAHDNSISQSEVAAYQDVLDEKKDAFKAYFQAYYEAQAIVAENPKEVMGKYAEEIGVDDQELDVLADYANDIDWFKSEYTPTVRNGDKQLARQGYDEGILENEPPVDEMFVDPREW